MQLKIDYTPAGPECDAFFYDDSFVRGIRGPIGSGKSTACAFLPWRHLFESEPGHDGKRRARWAVIRNTYPELKTTTIKTWHQWFPREMGRWQDQGPPTHWIQNGDIDLEVMFLALDRPDDIAKLLSLELTGAWINEAREVPKAILDGLTGRVGRFPPVRGGAKSWSGVVMDTNSPDTDHWWYRLAEEQKPEGFRFWCQPGGREPNAENLENLPPKYYERASAGKDDAWVKVYVDGDYGFVQDGKPVYPEWRDQLHAKPCEPDEKLPLWIGIDFGLTPAAAIAQRTFLGQWRYIDELVTEDMGAVRFGELLKGKLDSEYKGFKIAGIYGDPSGDNRSPTDENTPFAILRAQGIPARPAHSNDPVLRREAFAKPLTRLIDGEPGLIVDPRCRLLRKGLMGGYRYKRVMVTGAERYQDKPEKNHFSHVCEAGQYLMLGAGEGRALKVNTTANFNRHKPAEMADSGLSHDW